MAKSLSVASVFGDHMVLQSGMPVPIWGEGKPGASVSVSAAGQRAQGVVDPQGRWAVKLGALAASTAPMELSVQSDEQRVLFTDVLVGEVWVASGQSNMEWPVSSSNNAAEEIAGADLPLIRLFQVPRLVASAPKHTVDAVWQVCSPQTVGAFSAVAFFFGRHLHQQLKVPVGLIHPSWGGTPAESWTSREALLGHPQLQMIVERFDAQLNNAEAQTAFQQAYDRWVARAFHQDTGNLGETQGWAGMDHASADWKTMALPQYWQAAGLACNGAIWFRREIDVPAAAAGQEARLRLGPVDDYDTTYFNGERIGATGPETPNAFAAPREYRIPGRLIKAGRNVIAVRVFDHYGQGGIYGQPLDLVLGNGQRLPLAGDWLYRIERRIEPCAEPAPPQPLTWENAWAPSGLFNAMLHPVIPYAIRGAIWYQGESNADRAEQYRWLLEEMISDWRRHWGQGDFPFLIVQLANFGTVLPAPAASDWAELREAQHQATTALANAGLAVSIDIGAAADIHPRNKQEVGRRLALAAERLAYGREVNHSGPVYESMTIEGDRIRLRFQHAEGLTTINGQPLSQFAIAGEDRKFVWADATIEGNEVVVRGPTVSRPLAVRYQWANSPLPGNLTNASGLPAVPFRTDNWPGMTAGKR
jgi:sialate O-acetylesterase